MRTRKFFIGLFGGLLVASIGSAASAGVIVTRSESVAQDVVVVFLAIWITVGLLSLFTTHPRTVWRLIFALLGLTLVCIPLAWYGYATTEAMTDPASLFAVSRAGLGLVATVITLPLGALSFLFAYLIGSKH